MVRVYGKPGCVQCEYTTKKLAQLNVPYQYHDVTKDPKARQVVEKVGKTQLPLVVANEQMWHGFKIDKIKALGDD